MKHVVHFGGGVTSWAAARRVVDRHGPGDVVLLFADTKREDEDLHRFLVDCERDLGVPMTRIADGRDIWQVFEDEQFIGNSLTDPCSKILKRKLLDRWAREHCTPEDVHYVGLDWTEPHRVDRFSAAMAAKGVKVAAPLTEAPFVTKADLCAEVRRRGFEPPRLYALGFPHNNCGGFCVKAGHAQFKRLLEVFPDRYADHEANEERLRQKLGDVSVMRDRRGGKSLPLTMRAFRERVQRNETIDLFDWGGCGCATDEGEPA